MRLPTAKKSQRTKVIPVRSAEPEISEIGYVDFYGYVEGISGWFFIGWTHLSASADGAEDCFAIARFDRGGVGGKANVVFFQRADLDSGGIGIVAFVPGSGRVAGKLVDLRLQFGSRALHSRTVVSTQRFGGQELLNQIRPLLIESALANANRLFLLRLIARPIYRGEDTTASLPEPIYLGFDEFIVCQPAGLLLIGWRLGAGASYALRLRSGQLNTEFVPERGVKISRPDVVATVGQPLGFVDLDCGFAIFLPNSYSVGETTFVEIETSTGAVAFKNAPVSQRSGLDAIKHILEITDVRSGAIDPCFDNVVGPAVRALNQDRLRSPIDVAEVAFGKPVDTPTHSIVVPLHGRIDFVEYQMAQFSRDQAAGGYDIIYVLDDPPRRRELEVLAQSVFERFEIPFRLLLLSRNLGFAPANNVGLRAARGKFVCYLNSDAFPETVDWARRLSERIERHPEIGAIGARLFYEDGSVQHEGCVYQPLPEFGGWTFLLHENKCRRPSAATGLRYCPAITGACMVLERQLAEELGGFDEAYILGDFEDSDLCMKIRERGRQCAVDLDVRLYHLERKSQARSSHLWRQNLTLYNAWVHQRRWIAPSIARESQAARQAAY